MRKYISVFVFLGVLLGVCACGNKIETGLTGSVVTGDGSCTLTVGLDFLRTKVAAQTVTNEKTIQNVQVFVFRAGDGADRGVLEISASRGFDTPLNIPTGQYSGITVNCSTGLREVWVVVNDSHDRTAVVSDGAVRTKAEFLAQYHDLENSAAAKLVMVGRSNPESSDPAIMLRDGAMNVPVPVRHLAAAVTLESIVNRFSSPAYQKANTFRLEAAYLMNVPGRYNFGETSEASALPSDYWYAKLGPETSTSRKALIYDEIGTAFAPVYLNMDMPYSTPHTFYTYPNRCAPNEDTSWSPRSTVLVVEASILYGTEWQKYYYPVVLNPTGGLLSNKNYHVTLTIHRPGSLDPNIPVKIEDLTPLITVTDFEDGGTIYPEI